MYMTKIIQYFFYMLYYLLCRSGINTYIHVDCIKSDEIQDILISQSLSHFLNHTKNKITNNEKQWDICKKYTNPYEYIHSIVPYKKKSISQYKPLSRSYFKMIEMLNIFEPNLAEYGGHIRSFHLAEGPGGFIEAISKYRGNPNDVYVGMTLLDDMNDPNIPGWKKTQYFLQNHPNVKIELGADNTGNILNIENFVHCVHKYGNSMQIITGDGGFDFSTDFKLQEVNIVQLLFAQICYAVCMQKYKGTFILKIFDAFMPHTVDLIYILSSFYEKVYIVKPHMSRYANSEKYLVCKHFLFRSNAGFYQYFYMAFSKMMNPDNKYISRFLNIDIPYYFLKKLEEYNAVFGQKQIQNIHYTFCLMENKKKTEKIEQLLLINNEKCIDWCIKNNVPYNILFPKNVNGYLATSNTNET